ncbi:hypothetical protein C7974DRAFT_433739 [Boeremia exigua]|uniref:uncharacterized protein n=1 Tax=Boeremia exigua TaxID=749465 RepID=UPI001E8EAE3A|nr:uncharacterized protein C7974DRAFT_433739 [Boeremia exigua]KAH6629000.1 hypothetical protein C7974DRAFT_433739 [Boeremia exigua]
MTMGPEARSDPRNANLPLVNQPQTILGTTITFLSLALLTASLRLIGRWRSRFWGWEDACVFFACVASACGDTMVCLMPFNGLGLHFATLSASNAEAYYKDIWASNSAYCASTTFIKLAILLQYRRLFVEAAMSTASPRYRLGIRCVWAAIAVSAMWGLSFFFLALFPCQPVRKSWKIMTPGKCVGWGTKDPNKFFNMWASHAASNMFLDIVVLLLPVPFLGILDVRHRCKRSLIALFSLGAVVVLVSIGRLIALCISRAGTYPVPDMSYHAPIVFIFSVLEVNIAIWCASIPIFWPMISSLAANKILVVNEIVVRVEQYPKGSLDGESGIGLSSQLILEELPSSPAPSHPRRLSTLARTFDHRPSRDSIRKPTHKSKGSITSRSDHERRSSQDSQRNLYRSSTHDSNNTPKSDYDWFTELDRECVGRRTITRIETGNAGPRPDESR